MAYFYDNNCSVADAIGEAVKCITAMVMEKAVDGRVDMQVEDDGSISVEKPKK